MPKTKDTAPVQDNAEAVFDKNQLVHAKTLDFPRDVLTAALEDGKQYTKSQAISLATAFLERKV